MNSVIYKDLEIGFVSTFNLEWNDQGSGGKQDGSFYRPDVSGLDGFFPIGDYAQKGYSNPNGSGIIAVVKDLSTTQDVLQAPKDFELVWKDSGSGAKLDGSMWRPIPADDNHVAMGIVCNSGYNKPDVNCVRCVHKDYVVSATPGSSIWLDVGTGAKADFGSWTVSAPTAVSGMIYLAPGTFLGCSNHSTPPQTDPNLYALIININSEQPSQPLPTPVLNSTSKPSPYETDTVSYSESLPWFAVKDPNLSPIQQFVKSPLYTLKRTDQYKLIGFGFNTTNTPQEYSYAEENGTSGENSTSFSETTGITLGFEYGFSEAFSVSAELSQTFTYTTNSTSGWSKSQTKSYTATVPSNTAVAVYCVESDYKLYRADGSQLSVDVPYCDAENYVWVSYPKLTHSSSSAMVQMN